MVWSLVSADPLLGEEKYYIFSRGTFKVGRKGCDIIVNRDKGISRVHAEIIVDAMTCMSPGETDSPQVRIRDSSKYGTFINKNLGSEERVHDKETTLRDGYVVRFGTGNAVYRFSFVPLVFLFLCSELSSVSLRERLSFIGASAINHLNQDCTHVLVDQFMEVNEVVLDAVAAKKPLLLSSWIESVAEQSIRNNMPSYSGHIPSLAVEGVSVQVADPKTRETCLEGYTFILEPLRMYEFGSKLEIVLDVAGSKTLSADYFFSTVQDSEDTDNNRVVYVTPGGSQDNRISKRSMIRVDEKDLLRAILCGHLNPSLLRAPPVAVSSSCSTDETIVADSDLEDETSRPLPEADTAYAEGTTENKEKLLPNYAATKSEDVHSMHEEKDSPKNSDGCVVVTRDKIDEPDEGISDIIYTGDIIVRTTNVDARSTEDANELNFKRFRKRQTPSGNSFSSLVPFAKFPYKDSDYGNEEVAESVKEEKRRKKMEAIAEDLFNNEKGRKRGFAGSLHGLLTRG